MFMFFFFKQKTAYEITRRDWSSDVCSSDLPGRGGRVVGVAAGDDERRDLEPQQILRLGAGDGVAVEEGAPHVLHDRVVARRVEAGVLGGEGRVAADDAHPRTDPGVLGEALVAAGRQG